MRKILGRRPKDERSSHASIKLETSTSESNDSFVGKAVIATYRHLTKTLGHYEITGARAIDGDTIEAIILLPFGTMSVKRIRLAGWWAPELNGMDHSAAIQARDSLQRFLTGNPCSIFSRSERQDKYGRIIASLWSNGKVVEPATVLGLFVLTEAQHKTDADWKRKNGSKLDALMADPPAIIQQADGSLRPTSEDPTQRDADMKAATDQSQFP